LVESQRSFRTKFLKFSITIKAAPQAWEGYLGNNDGVREKKATFGRKIEGDRAIVRKLRVCATQLALRRDALEQRFRYEGVK